jgi:hypothetical protein
LSKTLVLSSKTVALQFLSEENSVNSQKDSFAALTKSRKSSGRQEEGRKKLDANVKHLFIHSPSLKP